LAILGTRGVPARHGGFETFAEHLGLYLVGRGWEVTIYCQQGGVSNVCEDQWRGIRRVQIPIARQDAWGTVLFDWRAARHAASERPDVVLTLGYNTAVFCGIYRLKNIPNVVNMDGIEWRRDKWSRSERAWLYFNERLGCWFGDHLIADHPEINRHLATRVTDRKITTIPYGADPVESADPALLTPLGLVPGTFALVIARPEPENSVLDVVRAFSAKRRGMRLVVLGNYQPSANAYHELVLSAASDDVIFPGAIYEEKLVNALRYFSSLYIHGHTVGGTNPSLVEALGAGSPVLAHDNPFNRWVAGVGACYFSGEAECGEKLDRLFKDDAVLQQMREASRLRFEQALTWEKVLPAYKRLLAGWACSSVGSEK